MRQIRLLLVGFGNVGEAFLHLLLNKHPVLEQEHELDLIVTGICTATHGGALDPVGLDLELLLETKKTQSLLTPLSTLSVPKDTLSFIGESQADVMLEISPVNYDDGQPAISFIQHGLRQKMHAITANKGPVVHAYQELKALADKVQRSFFCESTVMDGAPILSLWRETLPAARMTAFRGILNSTTNFILAEMEKGFSMETSLEKAQARGIAETDPSGDMEGWDAAIKVGVLSTVMMDTPLTPKQVDRQGIESLSTAQVEEALSEGRRWKLICTAEHDGLKVQGVVRPMQVDPSDPLFHVSGTSSAVTLFTDVLGPLTLIEENPGPETTAYGLLADVLNAVLPDG